MRHEQPWGIIAVAAVGLFLASVTAAEASGAKISREEGEFKIFIAGKEIGTEKYIIVSAEDSASSSSVLDFRNPGETHQRVHFTTKLDMNARYVPRAYELKSEVDGKKGSIVGLFKPNEVIFEYHNDGSPKRSGLLVGDEFTLLDTNIFHHFIFLARLFNFDSKEKSQKFEVVIPQEPDSGFLKISDTGKEAVVVQGKKIEAHRLQADSGSLRIQLWVDDQHMLHRIVVKDRDVEVVRVP